MLVDLNDTLLYKSSQIVAYTDDINILVRCKLSAKEVLVKLNEVSKDSSVNKRIEDQNQMESQSPTERLG